MLSSCGTSGFLEHSSTLYGTPTSALQDEKSTSVELANQFNKLFDKLSHVDVGSPPPACYLADYVAERMSTAVNEMFGKHAPEVLVVDDLSANALAGPKRIRIRRDACFTDKDIMQLIHHEAYIHVATSLNGIAQINVIAVTEISAMIPGFIFILWLQKHLTRDFNHGMLKRVGAYGARKPIIVCIFDMIRSKC
ncbi:MAG: hypothetical protein ACI8VW_003643 [bacterium]